MNGVSLRACSRHGCR